MGMMAATGQAALITMEIAITGSAFIKLKQKASNSGAISSLNKDTVYTPGSFKDLIIPERARKLPSTIIASGVFKSARNDMELYAKTGNLICVK